MANLSNINNKFLVTTGGNVLIGQTGAIGSSLLQVNGVIGVGSSNQTTLNQTSTHFFMDMTSSTSYFRNTSTAGGGFIFRNSNIGDFEFDNEFAGNIKFNTSNVEAMRIDSSGDTHLQGNLFFEGSTSYVAGYSIRRQGANFIFTGGTTGTFFNRNGNGATDMYINASGFVGIGATSPTNQLHVHTETDNAYGIRIEGSTNNVAGVWTGLGIGGENANTKSALLFEDTVGSYARGKLHLCVNNGADQTSATPADAKLTIIPTGNVGIGTDDPVQKLQVNGQVLFRTTTVDGSKNRFQLIPGGSSDAANLYLYYGNTGDGTLSVRINAQGDSYFNGGDVGIGVTSPGQKLHVVGNIKTFGNIFLQSNANGFRTVALDTTNGADNQELYLCGGGTASSTRGGQVGVYGNEVSSTGGSVVIVAGNVSTGDIDFLTANTQRMRISNVGRVNISNKPNSGLGYAVLIDVGTGATGDVGYQTLSQLNTNLAGASDIRFKKNIEIIPNAIKKIKTINGYTFDWDSENEDYNYSEKEGRDAGIIAQEIQKVLPEIVQIATVDRDEEGKSTSGKNYLSVDYKKIIPLLIQGIKEQETSIQELKAEIELLKSK